MDPFEANIRLAYAFHFFMGLHFIGGILIPFFMFWGKITFFQLMMLEAIFVISRFILEIPTGALADRCGRKPSLYLGALVTISAVFAFTSYPLIIVFVLGEILWAAGDALISGASDALVYDSLVKTGKERTSKKVLARVASFHLLGLFFGGPISSVLGTYAGIREAVMLSALPFALAFFISMTMREPPVKRRSSKDNYLATLKKGVRYFTSHSRIIDLTLDGALVFALLFMVVWVNQLILIDFGVPMIYFGFVIAGLTGLEALVLNSFGHIERLLGSKKNYLTFSAVLPALCMILLGMTESMPLAVLLIVLIGGFGLSRLTLMYNYMQKFIESKFRATVISTASMVTSILVAAVYLISGYLVEWSLDYSLMIMGVLVLVISLFSRVKEEHLID